MLDLDDPGSVDRFMAANRAVHVTVAEAAGNGRAAAIVARLFDDSERARLVALRGGAAAGRGLRARAEHRAPLDALEAGEGAEAERLMAEAIAHSRPRCSTPCGPLCSTRRSPRPEVNPGLAGGDRGYVALTAPSCER